MKLVKGYLLIVAQLMPCLQTQLLSLLCLGEIRRRIDLSAHANIEGVVIGSFQSPSKEIKAAASYALGNITVGNLAQYLLLHSLKEVKTPVHLWD
jgi:hypothetical protein